MIKDFQELKNDIYKLNEQQKNDFIYTLMGSFEYFYQNDSEVIDKKTVLQSLKIALKHSK